MIGEFMVMGGLLDNIGEVTGRVVYNYLYLYKFTIDNIIQYQKSMGYDYFYGVLLNWLNYNFATSMFIIKLVQIIEKLWFVLQ